MFSNDSVLLLQQVGWEWAQKKGGNSSAGLSNRDCNKADLDIRLILYLSENIVCFLILSIRKKPTTTKQIIIIQAPSEKKKKTVGRFLHQQIRSSC